ncbi:4Fe-4S binding protein [candidate division CSSED10-310 bacterium]|uniref:4Fe-4S binding protein n=1 Tax=candidate division CSSED10-310 bacterium TaxID=2855610 RepID=A0ABV6YVP6_UNCC1
MMEKDQLVPRFAEPRFPIPHPYLIERSERCINCGTCITACPYDCHARLSTDPRRLAEPKNSCCRVCWACILRCPRGALSLYKNPDFVGLSSSEVFQPEIIRAIQNQATDGKVPVSGSGYGGLFDGEGFDGIWTDMSEIVRPTRDGIHGREHISTTVNLGRKIADLNGMEFDSLGNLKSLIPVNREIPIPILLDVPPYPVQDWVITSLALAASKWNTFVSIRADYVHQDRRSDKTAVSAAGKTVQATQVMDFFNHLIVKLSPESMEEHREKLTWASIVEIEPGLDQLAAINHVRTINPQIVTILRVPAHAGAPREIVHLASQGAEVIHLSTDISGYGDDKTPLWRCLPETHQKLIEAGIRDEITLLASGGFGGTYSQNYYFGCRCCFC